MNMTIASPAQMVEAWEVGVMNGNHSRAREEVARYPRIKAVVDPTYYRDDDDGWRSASSITNRSAIRQMQAYLERKGLTAPVETQAAWINTERCLAARDNVEGVLLEALRNVRSESESTYVAAVLEALATHYPAEVTRENS